MTDDTTGGSGALGAHHDPMTEEQRLKLDSLSNLTGEPTPDEHLSEHEAARMIKELRDEAGYDTSTDDQDEP